MTTTHAAVAKLESITGESPVLEHVDVQGTLHDLLADVSLTQIYCNRESHPIEAVYTFPLPVDGVLLDLRLKLGERTLHGVVVGKKEAEDRYEDAITDGDTAILLQEAGPGLYTMNVGNLQAGERAEITLRYAQLNRWTGDSLRFRLPTTVAPRYGDVWDPALEPHQIPETGLDVEHALSFELRVTGLLSSAQIASPTHPIVVRRTQEASTISLSKTTAFMDRDLVIELKADRQSHASMTIQRDGERYVALATFQPVFGATDNAARSLKIVIDCSGSMGGDSITQAREAVLRILDELRPQDYFNLITFGSKWKRLFERQVEANPDNLEIAREFARRIDATMGGTEMAEALNAAYQSKAGTDIPTHDVLLVTDGEISQRKILIDAAMASGHRHFTVGVGSSVAEDVVSKLATETGGSCELVTPQEDMAERIHRHFKRIYFPRATRANIQWPAGATDTTPKHLGTVYSEDTIHAFAWFNHRPDSLAYMEFELENGASLELVVDSNGADILYADTGGNDAIARIGVYRRVAELKDDEARRQLAVEYQIVTPGTHCIIIDARETGGKATELPRLRKVKSMLAAGWSGAGSTRPSDLKLNYSLAPDFSLWPSFDEFTPSAFDDTDHLNDFVRNLNNAYPYGSVTELKHKTLSSLISLGLKDDYLKILSDLCTLGMTESETVAAFFKWLLSSFHDIKITRNAKRAITQFIKTVSLDDSVYSLASDHLGAIRLPRIAP